MRAKFNSHQLSVISYQLSKRNTDSFLLLTLRVCAERTPYGERQMPLSGNPLRLRSAPYACGTATPIGASCHNALNPTPFGFASRLGRETLLQRWSHQIPRSGNPHQVLAPQGTTLGSTGLTVH
jgi:hypothetical protein